MFKKLASLQPQKIMETSIQNNNLLKFDFIVLIPVFNNQNGLLKSINSINYDHKKHAVLVVDDGSLEPISAYFLRQNCNQKNISIIRFNENRGIVHALNAGLKEIEQNFDTKFIARLDCDDICHPERFEKQVAFLTQNPEIDLLGTWCRFEESSTRKGYLYKTKTEHNEILKQMHYKCSFIHPTVMFKKYLVKKVGYYPTNFPHAEDYAYFWEILKIGKGAILAENLVTVEMKGGNVSRKFRISQIKSRAKIVANYGRSNFFSIMNWLRFYLISFYFQLKLKKYDS